MNSKKIKHLLKNTVTIFKTKNIVPIVNVKEENKLLDNKIAFITGGSGGIGYAIAKSFIEAGCKVIISGRNEEKLLTCVNKLGGNCFYTVMNLNNYDEIDKIVDELYVKYGNINILVNSAGIHSIKPMTDFFNTTVEEFDSILDTNLKSAYFISQKFASMMIKNKIEGHILNVSSSTASEPAWSAYRLSKLGLEGLTKGLAQTLTKHKIIVNGLAPGSTATEMLGYKSGDTIYTHDNECERFIMPSEIAYYAKILVSDLGNMVCGSTFYISGGRGTYDIR